MSGIINKVKDKLQGDSAPGGQHPAAMLVEKGKPLQVSNRPTPTPGPDELLLEVKSIAFNPVDYYQRDYGMMVTQYPAVLGSDVGGVVISAGSAVPADLFKKGTRVTAFATVFYAGGEPDYGAMQQYVRVPAVNAAPIPDSLTFSDASLLPMAVGTTWAGLFRLGVPRTGYTPADKRGLLIWGGASSVGTAAIQTAKILGYTTYVTASAKNHAYLKTLGADHTFDYKDADVVQKIVAAARADGVTMPHAYHATGDVKLGMAVLSELNGSSPTHIAHAPLVPEGLEKPEGMEVTFVTAPDDPADRAEHFKFVFNSWLMDKLATGKFVPSPAMEVVPGGLEGADKALDKLRGGVSGVKIVVEL